MASSRRHLAAAWIKGDHLNALGVGVEHLHHLSLCRIPDPNASVESPRGQPARIGAESNRAHQSRMPSKQRRLLNSIQIPDLGGLILGSACQQSAVGIENHLGRTGVMGVENGHGLAPQLLTQITNPPDPDGVVVGSRSQQTFRRRARRKRIRFGWSMAPCKSSYPDTAGDAHKSMPGFYGACSALHT